MGGLLRYLVTNGSEGRNSFKIPYAHNIKEIFCQFSIASRKQKNDFFQLIGEHKSTNNTTNKITII